MCLSYKKFWPSSCFNGRLKYAKNDLIAILDGDLQDPPEIINFLNI